jgi:hypothetical protein
MGTNYYFRGSPRYAQHIGKRSAAGWFCWDCNISLCKHGNNGVHKGKFTTEKGDWYTACPKCGLKIPKEDITKSSAGRELGFNKSKPKHKTGVASCASFSWAITESEFKQTCSQLSFIQMPNLIIQDEYGEFFTEKSFQAVLSECPIQFFNSIGTEFS